MITWVTRMCNELKRDRIRLFRGNNLRTNRVIISSHGGQRRDGHAYNPPGITFYMDPRFGSETRGTLDDWVTRYENDTLHPAGAPHGAVGDYVLTKFQGYHDTEPRPGRRLAHFFRIRRASESYQDIRNFVDSNDHVPIDVVTIRNVRANRNGMYLSDVIDELGRVAPLRYTEVVLAFCLVPPGYGGYVDMLTGEPY